MREKLDQTTLNELVRSICKKKFVHEAVFYISSDDEKTDLISAGGEMEADSRYYIASINKFFISAIILQLISGGKLKFQDKLADFISDDEINGLQVYGRTEYSKEISILHMLSQTSGLPCYLIDKQPSGRKGMEDFEAGIDQAWPVKKVIQEIKQMEPHFPPGTKNRAKYGDTNHQLLSLVIEKCMGMPVKDVLHNLFRELGMTDTFVFEKGTETDFIPIRFKSKHIHLPLFLASTRTDIISTARDQMVFLKAFFNGRFFSRVRLRELEKWNGVFFPFKYGIGIQKFYLPRILSPFSRVPDLIGHGGSVGSLAFYTPEKDLFITGTINQQSAPGTAYQAMIKIINKF